MSMKYSYIHAISHPCRRITLYLVSCILSPLTGDDLTIPLVTSLAPKHDGVRLLGIRDL